jgi:hypothetical protein
VVVLWGYMSNPYNIFAFDGGGQGLFWVINIILNIIAQVYILEEFKDEKWLFFSSGRSLLNFYFATYKKHFLQIMLFIRNIFVSLQSEILIKNSHYGQFSENLSSFIAGNGGENISVSLFKY